MPGEPEWFDVTKLECIEIETATGAEIQSNVIDWGEKFYLKTTIKGDNSIMQWVNMKTGGVKYRVKFFAKSMTPNIPDADFGTTPWTDLAQDEFSVKSDTVELKPLGPPGEDRFEALYTAGCWVLFQHHNGARYYGVLGWNMDCPIQISAFEEPE